MLFFFINAVKFQKNGGILVPLSTCAIFGFYFCWSVAEIFHFHAKDGGSPCSSSYENIASGSDVSSFEREKGDLKKVGSN